MSMQTRKNLKCACVYCVKRVASLDFLILDDLIETFVNGVLLEMRSYVPIYARHTCQTKRKSMKLRVRGGVQLTMVVQLK